MTTKTIWVRTTDYMSIDEPVEALTQRLQRNVEAAKESYPEGFKLLLSNAELDKMFPGQPLKDIEMLLGVEIGVVA